MKAVGHIAVVLALCLSGTARAAALRCERERFTRVDTEHFTLIGNASERRIVEVGTSLERLREAFAGTTEGMELRSPLPTLIVVFEDEESFAPYALGESGKPENLAGYFLSARSGNYMAIDASAGLDEPFHAVNHEYLHYILENNFLSLPVWLDEGLAELYGTFKVYGKHAAIGLPINRHLELLKRERPIPLGSLFAVTHDSPEYNEEERQGMFYAESWALTHWLMAPERRAQLGTLLGLLQDGMHSEAAFEQALGLSLQAAETALAAYVRSKSFSYIEYTPPAGFAEPVLRTRPLLRQEVLYHLGDLLAHRRPLQVDSTERHLRRALELDPHYAEAYLALAFLRLAEDQPAEAIEECRNALAFEPGNARAHGLYGQALLMQFFGRGLVTADPGKGTPPLLAEAREHFRRSLELAPDDVESLSGLGYTYSFDLEELGEGLGALSRVTELLPARTDALSLLVVLTARSGNVAGARSLLDRALRRRGTAAEVERAVQGILYAELDHVRKLANAGKLDEARADMERLVVETRDPALSPHVERERARLASFTVERSMVEHFNEAATAANRGELERAIELLEPIAHAAPDPELRRLAAERLALVRRAADASSQ